MSKKKRSGISEDNKLEMALAALIKNTRTTSRHLSLPEVAGWLDVATEGYGSIRAVAERIGLSSKMLRQFLAVKELAPAVQDLFAERRLDSVDMASHLRMLCPEEQVFVGSEAARGSLNTADIRAICEFRKEHAEVPIEDVVEKVKSTRNIKQYIIEFVVRGARTDEQELLSRFSAVFGDGNIVSMALTGSIGKLVVNQRGRSLLQRLARDNQISQAEVINKIVRGEL